MTGNRQGFETLEQARDAIAAYAPTGRARNHSVDGIRRIVRQRAGRWYWHWDPAFVARPLDESEHDRQHLEGLAAGLTIPLLAVRGSLSEVVSNESAAAFSRANQQAKFVELNGVGHAVASQTNDEFNDAIVDFIVGDRP
jgi:pimeloyl-ACP methyl ester carboxylesterase